MTNTLNTTKSIDNDAVVRRLYAQGTWTLDSVAHFGGDDTGVADMCLLKDTDGNPFIPGASIAGAARSLLARKSKPWQEYKNEQENQEIKRLFGGDMNQQRPQSEKNKDTMSALIVSDATCVSKQAETSIRDGVRMVNESGIAADKAKFDVEVVERGTTFKLCLECVLRADDNQSKLEELFLALLHAFKQGEIRLGARTRRGYGRGKVASWKISDLQMDKSEHVMAWLRGNAVSHPKSSLTPCPLSTDQRQYFRIEADFKLYTSLLIRSVSSDPKAPDMVHLHSNEKPVIPGTSFAGAFRQRAALIAYALNWDNGCHEADPVCEMFGPVHKQDETKQTDLWASRVSVEERLVKKVEPIWQDRVAIDRFTGGSLQSALFNEKPVYPISLKDEIKTNVRLRLTLEEPEKAEIGLLLLTLRDFWYGHAALGGETSNGRGTLQGIKAKLIYKNTPDPSDIKEWRLEHKDKHMIIEKDDEGFLQCCVEAAQNYKDRPKASRRPKKNGEEEADVE